MLSNSEIVDIYLRSGLLRDCVRYQTQYACELENRDDVLQDLCVLLLGYDNGRMNQLHRDGRMNAFVTQVLRRELTGTHSKYYRIYKRPRLTQCSIEVEAIGDLND